MLRKHEVPQHSRKRFCCIFSACLVIYPYFSACLVISPYISACLVVSLIFSLSGRFLNFSEFISACLVISLSFSACLVVSSFFSLSGHYPFLGLRRPIAFYFISLSGRFPIFQLVWSFPNFEACLVISHI